MSFASLKKSSASSFAKLTQEIEKISNPSGGGGADERFWKPELDKSGNGYAVIRFLPAPDGEDIPFAKVWSHAFQGPGGWYIENSLTTLNKKDPVGELNRQLWNSGNDSDKEIARKQKRKLSYYANIMVVKDPLHPENEGQVKLYKFGKKIFDKINDAAMPEFEDEQKVDAFSLGEGANFRLKIRNVEGYRNYDKSEFDSPSEIPDDKLESIYNQLKPLQELVDPKNFKSYDELKTKLYRVLGLGGETANTITADELSEAKVAPQAAPEQPAASAAPWDEQSNDDDDDGLSFFKKLADE